MDNASYRDLEVWQKAMDLVMLVYDLTEDFPQAETYGLRMQMRNAAVAIASNIGEGHGKDSTRQNLQHLSIAHGAVLVTETQCYVAEGRGYLAGKDLTPFWALSAAVAKMLHGMVNALKRNLGELP
jgi:four helix bundle protein